MIKNRNLLAVEYCANGSINNKENLTAVYLPVISIYSPIYGFEKLLCKLFLLRKIFSDNTKYFYYFGL